MTKLSEAIRTTHTRDGGVVLDIQHGQMFRLNLVGSRILELLKAGRSEAQIALQISQEFGAEQNLVARDVSEFLALLEKHKLVHSKPGTPF